MPTIKDVTLAFHCPETPDYKLFCHKCAHTIVDFTNKTDQDLIHELAKSKTPLCGMFKKSQLSEEFIKYAAATIVAASLTIPAIGQAVPKGEPVRPASEKIKTEEEQDVFLGTIVETPAEPIGGYTEFIKAVTNKINYPTGLTVKGKSFVEVTIDTAGQIKDVKLARGFNEAADREAVRVLSTLNYPFKPGRQQGKPVKTTMVIPIMFDPKNIPNR